MEGEDPGGFLGSATGENEGKRLQEALGTFRPPSAPGPWGSGLRRAIGGNRSFLIPRTADKQGRWWVGLAVNCNAWS
eukprot:2880376-Pyramimonas_sp.AAC.1